MEEFTKVLTHRWMVEETIQEIKKLHPEAEVEVSGFEAGISGTPGRWVPYFTCVFTVGKEVHRAFWYEGTLQTEYCGTQE